MTLILLRIATAGILAILSLMIILFRVSPFSASSVALPFFFLTLFLAIASFGSLIAFSVWSRLPVEGMDVGKKLSVSLREGIFLSVASVLLVLLQILDVYTWWIGVLVYLIFVLVEGALHS
ncbi:MAG: hypothetical protein PHZ00_05420 [Candidatus Peribacteraceae bacterium]|nr:hypothetical protein [Candidatus Peribacteraceae bacterium]